MTLTLDAQMEERIQREIDLGHASHPAEVIARAMALLEHEEAWLLRNKNAINEHLQEGLDESLRGEGIPGDQVRSMLRTYIDELPE